MESSGFCDTEETLTSRCWLLLARSVAVGPSSQYCGNFLKFFVQWFWWWDVIFVFTGILWRCGQTSTSGNPPQNQNSSFYAGRGALPSAPRLYRRGQRAEWHRAPESCTIGLFPKRPQKNHRLWVVTGAKDFNSKDQDTWTGAIPLYCDLIRSRLGLIDTYMALSSSSYHYIVARKEKKVLNLRNYLSHWLFVYYCSEMKSRL